jgi:hypothetical protein
LEKNGTMGEIGDLYREIRDEIRERKNVKQARVLQFMLFWCDENHAELKVIAPWQMRVTKSFTIIDVFPQTFKYHDITFNQRGQFGDLFTFLQESFVTPYYTTIKVQGKYYMLLTEHSFVINTSFKDVYYSTIVTPMRVPRDRAGHQIEFTSGAAGKRYMNYSKTGPWIFFDEKPDDSFDKEFATHLGALIMEHGTP